MGPVMRINLEGGIINIYTGECMWSARNTMRRPLKQQLNDAEAKLKRRPQGIVVVGGGFPPEICMAYHVIP